MDLAIFKYLKRKSEHLKAVNYSTRGISATMAIHVSSSSGHARGLSDAAMVHCIVYACGGDDGQ